MVVDYDVELLSAKFWGQMLPLEPDTLALLPMDNCYHFLNYGNVSDGRIAEEFQPG